MFYHAKKEDSHQQIANTVKNQTVNNQRKHTQHEKTNSMRQMHIQPGTKKQPEKNIPMLKTKNTPIKQSKKKKLLPTLLRDRQLKRKTI